MRRNRLRELLRAGRPSIGTHVHSAWPPYDLFALENLARAVNTFDHLSAMFKVSISASATSAWAGT